MAFKYAFRADFMDGSSFTQAADDQSRLVPGKSSFGDFLELERRGMVTTAVALVCEWLEVLVDIEGGRFLVNGCEVTPGASVLETFGVEAPLGSAERFEWNPTSAHPLMAAKAHYFRNVVRDGMTGDVLDLQHCIGFESNGRKVVLGVR